MKPEIKEFLLFLPSFPSSISHPPLPHPTRNSLWVIFYAYGSEEFDGIKPHLLDGKFSI
jgi:hypothetical protein